jgi:hypothetical protein
MLWRLLVGFVIGLVMGGLLAAAFVAGLKITLFQGAAGVAFAYTAAALAGVLTGLFAGKPIWAVDAKLEAGLKAFFGALLAAGGMFALRQWGGGWQVDLNGLGGLGRGAVGDLPVASLPLLAAVLGSLFELDNTGDRGGEAPKKEAASDAEPRRRVQGVPQGSANGRGKAKLPGVGEEDPAAADAESRRARR